MRGRAAERKAARRRLLASRVRVGAAGSVPLIALVVVTTVLPSNIVVDGYGKGDRIPSREVLAQPADCPGARVMPPEVRRHLVSEVAAPQLPSGVAAESAEARAIRRLLLMSNRYVLTTRLPVRWASGVRAYDNFGDQPIGIRAASAQALGLAAATETGAFDEAVVGRSLGFARGSAIWVVRSLACGHAASVPGGWGAGDSPMTADLHAWQSPLWAFQAGAAGWLLWRWLPDSDRFRVAAMVVNEADRLVNVSPQYYGSADGRLLRPGDTKAEEDAWVGGILSLAMAMFPRHPHRRAWRHQEVRFQLAAYSTQADTTARVRVHGAPLSEWLEGWNVESDGTVVNHKRIHPHYATAVALSASAAGLYALAGAETPKAALHQVKLVYDSLLHATFAAPPFDSPGGTVYQSGSPGLYLPQGNDWGTKAMISHALLLDVAAHTLEISRSAGTFARLHAAALTEMQSRSWDGRAHQSLSEYKYRWAEEVVVENLSRAWLLEWGQSARRLVISDQPAPPASIGADQASGTAWTRYPTAHHAGATAGASRVAPTMTVLTASNQTLPRPDLPHIAGKVDHRYLSVSERPGETAAPTVAVDIVIPLSDGRPGYLMHLSENRLMATVTRLSDGSLICSPHPPPDNHTVIARVPLRCFGDGHVTGARIVTSSATLGTRNPSVAAATSPL